MLSATFRGPPPSQMQRRGRSRHVSPVALARQASEERRQSRPAPSPPSRPVSPPADPVPLPQSLEDQVQVAYALDNIRLAKILLLKLKGIHVVDDADPRIDQVRDEDFDICFAPSGPLTLDDADRRAVQETQRRQRQWWHESQRAQRLRACEKLWEDEKNRLHAQRFRALQRRERGPLDQDRSRLPQRNIQHPTTRSRLEAPAPTKRDQDPFQYTFMPPPKPSTSSLPGRSPMSTKKTLACSFGSHNRSVSFKDVINAMNGKLFPLDPSERAEDAKRIAGLPIVSPGPHRRKASVRAELLDSLLQVVEWQEGERRKLKGKDVVRDQQTLKSPVLAPAPMPSVPASVSATSLTSCASPSRSSSWLSFGSWRSTATDITTPDSPILASPTTSQSCLPLLAENQLEPYPRCTFVHISVEESPLAPSTTPPRGPTPAEGDDPCVTPSGSATEILSSLALRGALVKRVTRSVATLVEAAKGLQSAYITAAMFTGGPSHLDRVMRSHPDHTSLRCQHQARREGYRALAKDVRKFTDATTPISQTSEPVHFIPLVSQPSETTGLPTPPVPKNVIIFPSPLRPRTPPAALAYRMRPVANPAVLRLRALQNLMYARGKEWEGRAREGGLGCGKERMLGIAFEGRGRSGLGCEVRFVVA